VDVAAGIAVALEPVDEATPSARSVPLPIPEEVAVVVVGCHGFLSPSETCKVDISNMIQATAQNLRKRKNTIDHNT
jgi:hypothetical protein